MTIDGGLRPLFRQKLPTIHWVSIETGGTGRGIPDSNGCRDGNEFWVEFKQTKTHSVGLRPEQVAWLMRRSRVGGSCFVAVRCRTEAGPRRGPARDELWLFRGSDAVELKQDGLNCCLHLGVWEGGPANWCWAEIERQLLA